MPNSQPPAPEGCRPCQWLALATLLLWAPSLVWLVRERWMVYSGTSIGVIPLLVSTGWLALAWRKTEWAPTRHWLAALLSLGFSLWFWLAAWAAEAPIWQGYAMCAVLASLLWLHGGGALLERCAFPLLYLPLVYPLPEMVERVLGAPLRLWSAQLAGGVLQVLGLVEEVRGTLLTGRDLTLDVVPACSGLKMIYAFLVMGMLAARVLHRDWRWAAAQVLMIPLATLAANAIRIVGLGVAEKTLGPKPAAGLAHEGVGVAVFAAVFFALAVGLKKLSLHFSRTKPESYSPSPPVHPEDSSPSQSGEPIGTLAKAAPPVSTAFKTWGPGLHLALLLATVVLAWRIWPERRQAQALELPVVLRAFSGWTGRDAMLSPAEADLFGRDGVMRRSYERDGREVDMILYVSGARRRVVHEPVECYTFGGWTVEGQWAEGEAEPMKWLRLRGRNPLTGEEARAVAAFWFERDDGWRLADGRRLAWSAAWERLWLRPERVWRLYSLFSTERAGGEEAVREFAADLRREGVRP